MFSTQGRATHILVSISDAVSTPALITLHTLVPIYMVWIPRLAARSSRLAASELRELLKLLVDPTVISFAGGVPDPDLFPQSELRAAYDRALASPVSARIGLQYTISEGYLPLREWIAGYMRSQNIKCDPTNILILSGSQQGLDFTAKLFLDPQDSVIVQEPTFLGALQAFRSFEGTFDVLDTAKAAEEFRSGTRTPKLLYASADFRNPTGESETLLGRKRILSLAHRLDVALLEDNAYSHLRYDGTMLESLTALDLNGRHMDEGRSLYLGTFSKSVAPGLRVAWLAAPSHLIEKFVYIKQASDVQVSTLNQMVMTDVVSIFPTLVARCREEYRRRRDCMLDLLARHLPTEVTWTKPEGGFFIWVTLPSHINAAKLLEASLKRIKVAFVPGKAFFAGAGGHNTLRLSYSLNGAERTELGISLLGRLLKTMV